MLTAIDVIPLNLFRGIIQDIPTPEQDTFFVSSTIQETKLTKHPVFSGGEIRVYVDGNLLLPNRYELNPQNGDLKFLQPIIGVVTVYYFSVQLVNEELIMCLDNALKQHAPLLTWSTLPLTNIPYIQFLAAATAFYMLAAKWATVTRIKVEGTETHYDKVGAKYLQLAQSMEQRYRDACAGSIDIINTVRDDVFWGRKST